MLKVKKRLTGKSKRSIELYINNLEKNQIQLAGSLVAQAGEAMYDQVIANASRPKEEHTYKDLASLGHPFAVKHKSIQGNSLGGDWVSRPWMVHKREGNFVKNIVRKMKTDGKKRVTYRISYQYKNPNVRRIVRGTSVMLPRNVIGETYSYIKKPLKAEIAKQLRLSSLTGKKSQKKSAILGKLAKIAFIGSLGL